MVAAADGDDGRVVEEAATRSRSSVAEVTISRKSGRRGNKRLSTPSSKSMLRVRSCASSTMIVS
jgi:hypothetical protein